MPNKNSFLLEIESIDITYNNIQITRFTYNFQLNCE